MVSAMAKTVKALIEFPCCCKFRGIFPAQKQLTPEHKPKLMKPQFNAAVLAAALIALSAPASHAWDDTGHQVVAFIAYQRLSPAAKEKIDQLFSPKFEDTDPGSVGFDGRGLVYSPGNLYGPFTIANWMDDLRDNSYDDALKDWHHISVKPVVAGDFTPKLVVPNTVNVRERIIAMTNQAIKNKGFRTTKSKIDDRLAAEGWAFLFHLVGDVHQPLHCATRFSKEHPEGDFGGNLFKIDHPSGNLHSFWDKGGGLFQTKPLRRPLKKEGREQLAAYAKSVTDAWPADDHKKSWESLDPEDWVDESNGIARDLAFHEEKIKPGDTPKQEYIDETKKRCRERLAIAGYRLAALIERILGK